MANEPEIAVTLKLYDEHGKKIKDGRSLMESILDIRSGKRPDFSSFFSGGKNRDYLEKELSNELLEVFNNAWHSVIGKVRNANDNPSIVNAEYNKIVNLRDKVNEISKSLINTTDKIVRERRNAPKKSNLNLVKTSMLSSIPVATSTTNPVYLVKPSQRPNAELGNTREIPVKKWYSQKQKKQMELANTYGKGLNVGILNKNTMTKGQFTSTWGEGLSIGGFNRDNLFKELGGIRYKLFQTGKAFKEWREDLTSFYKESTKTGFKNLFKGGGIFGMIGKMFAGPWGWAALGLELLLKFGEIVKNLIKMWANFSKQFASNAMNKSIKALFKPIKLVLGVLTSLLKTALSRSQIFQSFIQSSIIPFIILLEYTFLPVIKTLLPYVTSFVKSISENKDAIMKFGSVLAGWLEGFLKPIMAILSGGTFFENPISTFATALSDGFIKLLRWVSENKSTLTKILIDGVRSIANMLKSSFELVQIIAVVIRDVILEAAHSDQVKSLVSTFKEVIITIMSSINDILLDPEINHMISDLVTHLLGVFISTFLSAMSQLPFIGWGFKPFAEMWNATQKSSDPYISDKALYDYYMKQIGVQSSVTPQGNTIDNRFTYNMNNTVNKQYMNGLALTDFNSSTGGFNVPNIGFNGGGSFA